MTSEQILKAAIEKAVENGWNTREAVAWTIAFEERPSKMANSALRNVILFDPDFAKALWGEGRYIGEVWVDGWECNQIHLLQMIQAGLDPIGYLKQSIG